MVTIGKNTQVKLYRMSMGEKECPWGLKAMNLLKESGIAFEDIKLTSQEEVDLFKAKYNVATTPQIFFDLDRIGGYTDLANYFGVTAKKADYSYTPVIALFSTAGLISLASSLGMTGFMGVSLSMLAGLKFMDINAFADSFAKYDLICQRFKPYGKIYPFLESMIGLGLLSGILPLVTGIGAFTLGISVGISVFKAVYIDKLELNCACVGGNSKAPLGVVSFAENAIMAIMGASLIFSNVSLTTLNQQQSLSPLYSSIVQEIKK